MARPVTTAWLLLACLLVASTTAQVQEEANVGATAGPDVQQTGAADPSTQVATDQPTDGTPAQEADDEFRIDPTPGPIDVDPSQMGRRNGFYR
jgi:hypothetical protein